MGRRCSQPLKNWKGSDPLLAQPRPPGWRRASRPRPHWGLLSSLSAGPAPPPVVPRLPTWRLAPHSPGEGAGRRARAAGKGRGSPAGGGNPRQTFCPGPGRAGARGRRMAPLWVRLGCAQAQGTMAGAVRRRTDTRTDRAAPAPRTTLPIRRGLRAAPSERAVHSHPEGSVPRGGIPAAEWGSPAMERGSALRAGPLPAPAHPAPRGVAARAQPSSPPRTRASPTLPSGDRGGVGMWARRETGDGEGASLTCLHRPQQTPFPGRKSSPDPRKDQAC